MWCVHTPVIQRKQRTPITHLSNQPTIFMTFKKQNKTKQSRAERYFYVYVHEMFKNKNNSRVCVYCAGGIIRLFLLDLTSLPL